MENQTQKQQIKREDVMGKMLSSNGRFFIVKFVKKNGETRILNGRIGVKKWLKADGGKREITDANMKYVTVYCVVNKGYRKVNTETVESFTIDKVKYEVVEETK